MADSDLLPVVVDNGSGTLKAGIAGDEAPRTIIPTVIGKPKNANIMVGMDQKEYFIGKEVEAKKALLNITHPIKQGIVQDWDYMEKIWNHCFTEELRVAPEDHKFMMTEAPLNPKKNRERMAQIMFEKIGVQKFYVGIQAVFSLYASGKTTGIVLDSGHSVTHSVPIYEGFALPHAIHKMDMGGQDLTRHLW